MIARVEVASGEVRCWLLIPGLISYLGWSGLGLYQPLRQPADVWGNGHLITVGTDLIAPRARVALPVEVAVGCRRDPKLIKLLQQASAAESRLMLDPDRDIAGHAGEQRMSPSKFARLLRLSYLAPDIKAAILDGRQPEELTCHKLLYAPLPSDWGQQRALLNFPGDRPS